MFFSRNKQERIQEIEQAIAGFYAIDGLPANADAIVALADREKYEAGKKQNIEISLGFTVKSTLEALTAEDAATPEDALRLYRTLKMYVSSLSHHCLITSGGVTGPL